MDATKEENITRLLHTIRSGDECPPQPARSYRDIEEEDQPRASTSQETERKSGAEHYTDSASDAQRNRGSGFMQSRLAGRDGCSTDRVPDDWFEDAIASGGNDMPSRVPESSCLEHSNFTSDSKFKHPSRGWSKGPGCSGRNAKNEDSDNDEEFDANDLAAIDKAVTDSMSRSDSVENMSDGDLEEERTDELNIAELYHYRDDRSEFMTEFYEHREANRKEDSQGELSVENYNVVMVSGAGVQCSHSSKIWQLMFINW